MKHYYSEYKIHVLFVNILYISVYYSSFIWL